MFTHLHLHTEYSNIGMMDSISKVDDVLNKVNSIGQNCFAISDHGTMSGCMEGYVKTQKYNKKHNKNIKFIFGAELYFIDNLESKEKTRHILFLAKNMQGYLNLIKLDSIAQKEDHFYRKPRICMDDIKKYSEGLYCTSACLGGILNTINYKDIAIEFKKIFNDDFLIEIHTFQSNEQKEFNKKMIKLSKELNIKMIACCDSHYVNKEDYELHKKFRGISKPDEDAYYTSNDFYIQTEEEVYNRLEYLPKDIVTECINNTNVIADNCNVFIDFGLKLYPSYDCDNIENKFKEICREGYKKKILGKYIGKEKEDIDNRIVYEMDVLKKLGYFDYFLINWDYLNYCDRVNIPRGGGRGSVGGCECAYLMDIIKLDATTNKLFFERFANPSRISVPDIDNDVSRKDRHKVIAYIKEKYGDVYQIRTFSYMKARGAIKRAGQALGLEAKDVDNVAKMISKFDNEDEEEIDDIDLQIMMLDHIENKENKELVDLAKKFVGIMQGVGKHASAVLVLNDDILKYSPLERQVNSKTKKIEYVAAYNYHYLEDMGTMKLDVLGLRTLDIIKECIDYTGEKIDIYNLSRDDNKTIELLKKGDTLGVFQLKSRGIVDTLKRINPTHFNDVMHTVALYRPACILSGMLDKFINRKNGTEEIIYDDERLRPVLEETFGCVLYQEQTMEIVKVLANYTMAEADTVRRGIGKKDAELLKNIMSDFVQRAIKNNTEESVAIKIADDIQKSASYGFNKAHSEKYGYLSYLTAYLKAHYPIQFYCANINNKDKQEEILPFLNECKVNNIKILPPDIKVANKEWIIEGDNIRVGLCYISGIGSNLDLSDLTSMERIYSNNNKKVLEALVKSGALDSFGERPYLLALIPVYLEYQKKHKNITAKLEEWKYKNNQKKIDEWTKKLYDLKIDEVKPIENYNFASTELETLGYTSYALPKIIKGKLIIYKELVSKKGNKYGKLTFDTDYGKIELTIFDRDMKKYKPRTNVSYMFMSNNDLLSDMKEVKNEPI